MTILNENEFQFFHLALFMLTVLFMKRQAWLAFTLSNDDSHNIVSTTSSLPTPTYLPIKDIDMPEGALLLSAPLESAPGTKLGVMSGEDVTEFDRPRGLGPAAVTQLLAWFASFANNWMVLVKHFMSVAPASDLS
jgi:hypothetical protein